MVSASDVVKTKKRKRICLENGEGALKAKDDYNLDEEGNPGGNDGVENEDDANIDPDEENAGGNDENDENYENDAYNAEYKEIKDEDDDGDKMKYLERRVSHGYHMVKGEMDHGMEDYIVAKTTKLDGFQLGLYAIFDGHSGRDVAEYLQTNLLRNILSEDDFWENPERAIRRAYKVTDDEILENVTSSRGGSTVVTAILIDERNLVVANVGDSRAVLCRNGKSEPLTVDHEPVKEKNLVERRGGFVSQKPGNVPRVDGQLSMTRAFGDGKLKHHIAVEPDISIETIGEDVSFVILASDGLWKVMSNQEACDCIEGYKDAQEASEELIKEALRRKSRDDISCIVIMFH